MTITFPLAIPTVRGPNAIRIRARSAVASSESPFTLKSQVYVWSGDGWEADIDLPPLSRAEGDDWIAFLLSLNGMEGSFLMGDPVYATQRGTWVGGSPLVNGASQTGKGLNIDGLTVGVTIKNGDWFQMGSGLNTSLYKIVKDTTANGSGQAAIDFWPRLRATPADNEALVLSSPKGCWRLAANTREWSMDLALKYGIKFSCREYR